VQSAYKGPPFSFILHKAALLCTHRRASGSIVDKELITPTGLIVALLGWAPGPGLWAASPNFAFLKFYELCHNGVLRSSLAMGPQGVYRDVHPKVEDLPSCTSVPC
jgi:hypothetical protein